MLVSLSRLRLGGGKEHMWSMEALFDIDLHVSPPPPPPPLPLPPSLSLSIDRYPMKLQVLLSQVNDTHMHTRTHARTHTHRHMRHTQTYKLQIHHIATCIIVFVNCRSTWHHRLSTHQSTYHKLPCRINNARALVSSYIVEV